MNFNYAREKRRFDKEWERLQEEYAAAGMDDCIRRSRTDSFAEQNGRGAKRADILTLQN